MQTISRKTIFGRGSRELSGKPQNPIARITLCGLIFISELFLLNCILLSCTKADIHYPTQGVVQIYPDQSEYSLPALTYHFYNADQQVEYFTRAGDEAGNYEGTLPAGVYRVIATNTDAANVTFSAMDSYRTATVRANALGIRSFTSRADYSMLGQPDSAYSVVVGELTVAENKTVRKEPSAALLTKRLNLVFSMRDGLDTEITSLSGILPGIYPAVFLYTFEGAQLGQSSTTAVTFEATGDGAERKTRILLFGIHDPAYGENYTNIMALTLTLTDKSTFTHTLNLTNVLSDIIRQSGGTLPLESTLRIEVTKTGIGVNVSVGEWIERGETEIYTK